MALIGTGAGGDANRPAQVTFKQGYLMTSMDPTHFCLGEPSHIDRLWWILNISFVSGKRKNSKNFAYFRSYYFSNF